MVGCICRHFCILSIFCLLQKNSCYETLCTSTSPAKLIAFNESSPAIVANIPLLKFVFLGSLGTRDTLDCKKFNRTLCSIKTPCRWNLHHPPLHRCPQQRNLQTSSQLESNSVIHKLDCPDLGFVHQPFDLSSIEDIAYNGSKYLIGR